MGIELSAVLSYNSSFYFDLTANGRSKPYRFLKNLLLRAGALMSLIVTIIFLLVLCKVRMTLIN